MATYNSNRASEAGGFRLGVSAGPRAEHAEQAAPTGIESVRLRGLKWYGYNRVHAVDSPATGVLTLVSGANVHPTHLVEVYSWALAAASTPRCS